MNTLAIGWGSDDFSFMMYDPARAYDVDSGTVIENVYDTLVGYKGNSMTDIEGRLAESWTLENNDQSYRFKLRTGVKFHSGNPFTCADAEYSLRRNLVTNHPLSSNWFLSESLLGTAANANADSTINFARIAVAVKCDGNDLVLTMTKYDPALLAKLAYSGQSVVDSKHAIAVGEWDGTEATWKKWVGAELLKGGLAAKPSGTGPYKVVSLGDKELKFTAFDGHWAGKPSIQNVVMRAEPDADKRLKDFLAGRTDLGAVPRSKVKGQPGVAVLEDLPITNTDALYLNQNIKPSPYLGSGQLDGQGIPADFFKDVNVRRGFVAALDVAGVMASLPNPNGKIEGFVLPEGFPSYERIEPPKFDMAAAEKALRAAWSGQVWEKGFKFDIPVYDTDPQQNPYLVNLKDNLAKMNPKFVINFVKRSDNPNFEEALAPIGPASWYADYADADNIVYSYFAPGAYNAVRAGINSPQLENYIRDGRSALIPALRGDVYRKTAELANDQALYIILPSYPAARSYRDVVQGLTRENYNPLRNFAILWKDLSKSKS
ncbi:ABC transporter substrate-binding protein [Deinococcus lacus]|uniref:ABC transporter substrate-binding protein n=1 Tax=Deinococcus lacus TaxID=392561 RepID=A0ABW1YF40_9DEIO